MNNLQTRDISEAEIVQMTEAEYAKWLREKGNSVILHRDRYWKQTYPGFYQPIHLMARLSYEQATCPGLWHWGFQSTLCAEDAALANTSLPIHLLTDVKGYDLHSLSSNRRYQVRKSKKLVEFVEIVGPNLFKEQGYEVLVSSIKRTGYGDIKKYLDEIANFPFGRGLVIAGLIDGKLGGFITAFAINETAYIDRVHIATESLSTCISPGLHFEFVQLCRRSGKIREIVHSLHSREDEALCTFKEGMVFSVQRIPSKLEINPMIDKFIRWRYPNQYYRLTGKLDLVTA